MTLYEFTIILSPGARPSQPDLEDRLFESGCDDALVCAYGNTVYLQFSREAKNARAAIVSAILDIRHAGFEPQVIEESGVASVSEMAARAGLTRAAINNYLKGVRGGDSFPSPRYGLTTKSPQFSWPEVAKWLYRHKRLPRNTAAVALVAPNIQAKLDSDRSHSALH